MNNSLLPGDNSAESLLLVLSEKARSMSKSVENFLRGVEGHETCMGDFLKDSNIENFSTVYSQTIVCSIVSSRLLQKGDHVDLSWLDVSSVFKNVSLVQRLIDSPVSTSPGVINAINDVIYLVNHTDLEGFLKKLSKGVGVRDLFTNFYEGFLSEFDPLLRKNKGVWYTPDPVVRFIVRVVHEILIKDFDLELGLADSSEIEVDLHGSRLKISKLQILDPCTGTGSFLAHIIAYSKGLFKRNSEEWHSFVENCLMKRLTGFEIMVSSYAIAHLRLSMALKDTDYSLGAGDCCKGQPGLFLIDTLKEANPKIDSLVKSWLSSDSDIGLERPIIAIIGNPPYSGVSSNDGGWISSLMNDYKFIEGRHFGEKKHWLNDDYVKFIRHGERIIEENGSGIVAFINNHSFIDNPTFRGMRWHLLQTFDNIYIINLHGNALKKEVAPDGSKDENVFDIKQGVSINIFIKRKSPTKEGKCQVYYVDVWGSRNSKYDFLDRTGLGGLEFIEVNPIAPQYFFYPQDTSGLGDYNKGVSISDLFPFKTVACVTGKDSVNISWTSDEVANKINFIRDNDDPAIRSKFGIRPKDARDWTVQTAKDDARKHFTQDCIMEFYYRPFDLRWTGYTGNSRGLYASPQKKVMQHLIGCDNIALIVNKQIRTKHAAHALVTKALTGYNILETANANPYILPLLLSPVADGQQSPTERPYLVNINEDVAQSIANSAGLIYNHSAQNPLVSGEGGQLNPIDILDYCYAVLHSNHYRTLYREYLNSDFPRIPLPRCQTSMLQLTCIGSELRRLHLFDQSEDWKLITTYPVTGSNCVESKMTVKSPGWKDLGSSGGRVFINAKQYFDGVTEEVWEFYVGAYQPAQKWLKDRAGRVLSYRDLRHYQLIVFCINRTINLIEEVDKVGVLGPGSGT